MERRKYYRKNKKKMYNFAKNAGNILDELNNLSK